MSKAELQGMNMWVRKAWSTRARRWMKMMPEDIRSRDPWLASTKKLVREWVKENVARKGEDAVLWGKWEERELEEEKLEEACPRPVWTEKQMKRRGEPPKKKIRRDENDTEAERWADKTEDKENEGGNKARGAETKAETNMVDKMMTTALSKKELAKKQSERREKLKIKKEIRAKKKMERELRKKEKEEKMIGAGADKNRRQPKLRKWARGEGGLEREGMAEGQMRKVQRTGGKKGVG